VHVVALQVRDSGRVPQVVQFAVRVCAGVPGVHSTETPVHALQAPNAPHVHSFEQVRVRVCLPFPQAPQACVSLEVCPGVQLAVAPVHSPVAVTAPHSHSFEQVCLVACLPVPHKPQACMPVFTAFGAHSAVTPVHALHSDQAPH
jgi:hypothetical protein